MRHVCLTPESKSHDGGSLSVISRKARELATQRLIQLATAGFGLLGLPPKHFYHQVIVNGSRTLNVIRHYHCAIPQDSCRSEIISVEELQTLLLLNRWPYEESEQFRIRKKCSNLNEDTLSSANGQVLNTFVQWKPHDEGKERFIATFFLRMMSLVLITNSLVLTSVRFAQHKSNFPVPPTYH